MALHQRRALGFATGLGTKGPIRMAKDQLILPRADSQCGKTFYNDRRVADGHRIALEFWNQATGHVRAGYQLEVHRCKRCGGFHVSQRRVEKRRFLTSPPASDTAGCWENQLNSANMTAEAFLASRRKRQNE